MKPAHRLDPAWMLGPTVVLLGVFFFYPLVYAAWTSLFEWDLLLPPRFVGLAHYQELFATGALAGTFSRTLAFSVIVVAGSSGLGLGLALLLNRPGPLTAFVRSAIFSAYVVSWVSVALLWMWLLDGELGLVARGLRALGVPAPDFLGDPNVALFTLAAVTMWKLTGYALVLFLAGLQDVDRRLLEAAALDGAGPWSRFVHVTWPALRPTAAFVTTTGLIASFQVFDVVRVMTQGGPVKSTTVFVYSIYEQVFEHLRVGRASAEVVLFFVLLMALTGLQLAAYRRTA